jgi:hypothetical protein
MFAFGFKFRFASFPYSPREKRVLPEKGMEN